MNKKQIEKLQKRKLELEQQAIDAFLDDANFSTWDWLSGADRIEFERIQFKLGESNFNPDKVEVRK